MGYLIVLEIENMNIKNELNCEKETLEHILNLIKEYKDSPTQLPRLLKGILTDGNIISLGFRDVSITMDCANGDRILVKTILTVYEHQPTYMEISLYLFKDINTFSELEKAYFANKPLYLLTKDEEISSTITNYKLLKLASVWKKWLTKGDLPIACGEATLIYVAPVSLSS